MKILIAGDFCEKLRFVEIFRNREFHDLTPVCSLTQASDFSIVNFEFPILFQKDAAIQKAGPNLAGSPYAIEALKFMGFNVCTLANNHILDQGEENCIMTQDYLNSSGIQTVGVGHNLSEAARILYLRKDDYVTAVINCCEHEFSVATETTVGANPLNPLAQYYSILEARKNADSVIVIVHGGNEHCAIPSERMKETYRFFVDVGADIVVNHHQHCMSGYEIYKDKPIFYGLGNFLFDHSTYRSEEWNSGYMVMVDLEKERTGEFSLIPYKQSTDTSMFKLIEGEEYRLFTEKIEGLNGIIADDVRCREEYDRWLRIGGKEFLSALEPYSSRFTKAMYRRGMLPSFLNKKKLIQLMNRLNCESHLDRFRFLLNESYHRTI